MPRTFQGQQPLVITVIVDQITFASCVEHWINNRHQCSHVKFDEDRLQEEEVILKMSNLIKTDYGLGRIGLTDKR